jgi:hypothetical protein
MASVTLRGIRWRIGRRGLFLAVSALASVSAVRQHGALEGLAAAILVGLFVWLFIWPLWLMTEAELVVGYLRRLTGWLLALSWPVAATWVWLLEPDHGVLGYRGRLSFSRYPSFGYSS